MYPQLGDNALEKLALDYLEDDDEVEEHDGDAAVEDSEAVDAGEEADSNIEMLESPCHLHDAKEEERLQAQEEN